MISDVSGLQGSQGRQAPQESEDFRELRSLRTPGVDPKQFREKKLGTHGTVRESEPCSHGTVAKISFVATFPNDISSSKYHSKSH